MVQERGGECGVEKSVCGRKGGICERGAPVNLAKELHDEHRLHRFAGPLADLFCMLNRRNCTAEASKKEEETGPRIDYKF